MVALVGDAELDEGNVFEALLEGWKHDVRNVWWVIDYNRQSLDARGRATGCSAASTRCSSTMGWRVVTLKYGKRLEARLRAARRRRAARLDRRLPELALLGAGVQGRRRLAQAARGATWASSGHPRACSTRTTTPRCMR